MDDDLRRRLLSRAERFLFLAFFGAAIILMFAACGRTIALPGISESPTKSFPEFRQSSQYPYDDFGNVKKSYVLKGSDFVEVFWKDTPVKMSPIKVSASKCTDASCKACSLFGLPVGATLVETLHPRLPISLLSASNQLDFTATNSQIKFTANLCDTNGKFILDPEVHPTWEQVETVFKDSPFSIKLIANQKKYAFPGDVVTITILSHAGALHRNDSTPWFTADQLQAQVDSLGIAAIPGLASPAKDMTRSGSLVNKWNAAIDNGAFLIRVWNPKARHSQQRDLQEIASCLSAQWSMNDVDKRDYEYFRKEIRECFDVGAVGEDYYSDEVNKVRYQLDVRQSWRVVFQDGSVFERRYLPGESVAKGVKDAVRDITGKELLCGKWYCPCHVNVVVLPRKELGPDGDSSPFWEEMSAEEASPLDSVLIMPGDTIHVSDRKPRTL